MFKKLRYFKADHSAYIQHEVQTMMRQAVPCIKQETLAYELGEDWTQKKVSQLEARETIDLDIFGYYSIFLLAQQIMNSGKR